MSELTESQTAEMTTDLMSEDLTEISKLEELELKNEESETKVREAEVKLKESETKLETLVSKLKAAQEELAQRATSSSQNFEAAVQRTIELQREELSTLMETMTDLKDQHREAIKTLQHQQEELQRTVALQQDVVVDLAELVDRLTILVAAHLQ